MLFLLYIILILCLLKENPLQLNNHFQDVLRKDKIRNKSDIMYAVKIKQSEIILKPIPSTMTSQSSVITIDSYS